MSQFVKYFGRLRKTDTAPGQICFSNLYDNVCACYRMSDMNRLQWKVHPDNEILHQDGEDVEAQGGSLVIKLYPMQIRTFALTVER